MYVLILFHHTLRVRYKWCISVVILLSNAKLQSIEDHRKKIQRFACFDKLICTVSENKCKWFPSAIRTQQWPFVLWFIFWSFVSHFICVVTCCRIHVLSFFTVIDLKFTNKCLYGNGHHAGYSDISITLRAFYKHVI